MTVYRHVDLRGVACVWAGNACIPRVGASVGCGGQNTADLPRVVQAVEQQHWRYGMGEGMF